MKFRIRKFGSLWFGTCDVCRRHAPRGRSGHPLEGRWFPSWHDAQRAGRKHQADHDAQFPFSTLFEGDALRQRVRDLEEESARLRQRLADRQAEAATRLRVRVR